MNKNFVRLLISIGLILVFLVSSSTVFAASKETPVVVLGASQTSFGESENVVINVTYSNPSDHTLRILKWFTPVDGLEEPVFAITVNGKEVSYSGAIYKRPLPTGNDYINLKSGESITLPVILSDYYDFSETGKYVVRYDATSVYLFSEKSAANLSSESLTSAEITLKVAGKAPKVRPTPTPPPAGSTAFNACTTAQQSILVSARTEAKTYASTAWDYLLKMTAGTSRYTTWFGAYNTSRLDTVTMHFDSLATAWNTAGVTFDCKCRQNYYAYVYPNKPYTIYLCRVFWQAPLTGTDSQAGTLIHEMSHFYTVASTQDYVYGQTGAMSLAISDPAKAVMNADNHEYFAENNPFKP